MLNIYLDNHTTTAPSPQAVVAMLPFLQQRWHSPFAPYPPAQELVAPIQDSYNTLYKLLGAKAFDFMLLTASNAEAINHLVWSVYLDVTRENGKNQFLTTNIEEAATILSMSRIEQLGCNSSLVAVDSSGAVSLEALKAAFTPRTALFSLAWANGMTGVLQPVEEIGQLCRENGVLFHLDASYVLGKTRIDLDETAADFISFNGNCIHAPTGMSVLCLRQGIEISPLIIGGAEQAALRGGEFNVGQLAALACAAQECLDAVNLMTTEIARLRDKLEKGLQTNLNDVFILFEQSQRLPNCTVIAFTGVSNEALLYTLGQKGLYASFGGGSHQQLTLLLTAIGIDVLLAQTAVHFSLSRYTTEEEIDTAVQIISSAVEQLRKQSHALLPLT